MYRAINKGQFVPVYRERESLMRYTYGCEENRFGLLTGSTTSLIPFQFRLPSFIRDTDSVSFRLFNVDTAEEVPIDPGKLLFFNDSVSAWCVYDGRMVLNQPYCGMFEARINFNSHTFWVETFELRELSGNYYRLRVSDTVDRPHALFTPTAFSFEVFFEAYEVDNTSEETIETTLNGYNEESLDFLDAKERMGVDIIHFPDYWKLPFDELKSYPSVSLYDYKRNTETTLEWVSCVDRKEGDCMNIGQLTWKAAHTVWNCEAGLDEYEQVVPNTSPE